MDDAINVHGTYLKIVQRIDDNTVVGRYMHPQAYGFYWGGKGDKVQFVRSNTMERLDHLAHRLQGVESTSSALCSNIRVKTIRYRLGVTLVGSNHTCVEGLNLGLRYTLVVVVRRRGDNVDTSRLV